MKEVRIQAIVDPYKCSGCNTCLHVCPTSAYNRPLERPLIDRLVDSPCNVNCPAGNDIEGMVYLMSKGNWDEALELLWETNPLPGVTGRVCNSPCEEVCNRGSLDESVSIRDLERALADYGNKKNESGETVNPRHGEKVAVIGSGPAGLSCAYHLGRQGFNCTVFEQKPEIGGVLRYGIPSYRLPKDILDQELERIRRFGVSFQVKRKWGHNLKMKDLEAYDAIFLALGFQKCRILDIPGEDGPDVLAGSEFLEKVNSGDAPKIGERVIVIGGGNSAVDSARVALRLGGRPVLVYRREDEDMPAIRSEIESLKEEGIEIRPLTAPVRFINEDGRLARVQCIRMEPGEVGKDGRKWPVPIPGSEFEVIANTAILCLGDSGDLEDAPVELQCVGERISADPWGRTSVPNIFAGGDIATGAGTVAHAIGSGRKAAEAIRTYLLGELTPKQPNNKPVAKATEMNFDHWESIPRQDSGRIEINKAISSFDEIHKTVSTEKSTLEAARCGHCGVRPEFHSNFCRGCSNCSSRCPAYAIELKELETPYTVKIDVGDSIREKVNEICFKAKINPESIVCFCTATRAMEIAAAIVKGAKKPEDVSRMTGARTGCGVLCIQPIFRLLLAAGLELDRPTESDVWYPTVPTIWDITEKVAQEHASRGFKFQEDKAFYEKYMVRELDRTRAVPDRQD